MSDKIIKILLVTIMTIVTTTSVSAQYQGEMAVGGGLSVATGDNLTNVGFGAKFQWNVIDNLRLEPSFNYFFKKNYTTMWDTSANLHYLFPVTDMVTLYPLAGLGIQNANVSLSDWGEYFRDISDTHFAFNLGAGADFTLTEEWILNFEFKYKIADINRAVFSLGIAYKF